MPVRSSLAVLIILAACTPAAAQHALGVEGIDPAFIERSHPLAGDRVTLCLNADSALAGFDRAVAEAVADALLLEASFEEVGTAYAAPRFDYRLQIEQTDLFVAMSNTCDGLMGYRLTVSGIPDWLTLSAPYYRSRNVMAVLDRDIARLEDLTPDDPPPGSRMGAPGDAQLRAYLGATGQAGQGRLGYFDNETLLAKLADGTISAALVWEPALFLGRNEFLAGRDVHLVAPPFDPGNVDFGIAFHVNNAFLRTSFDAAIEALSSDGTLSALAREHGLPFAQ